jgi:hypothetical protein
MFCKKNDVWKIVQKEDANSYQSKKEKSKYIPTLKKEILQQWNLSIDFE